LLKEKLGVELVLLASALEVPDLREVSINHYNFCGEVLLPVRHEDTAFFFFRLVKLTVKPDSSSVTSANLLFIVQDVQQMTSNSRAMHEA
jgi:hypothetical protein